MNTYTKKIALIIGSTVLAVTLIPIDSTRALQVSASEVNSSRCASCLHPRYVSHKFTTKSRTYVGTETHTTSTAVTVGYTGRSDWGSIQLGSSYSVSKTFKKYEVKYDSTATYDYYNAMGKFIRRETFNAVNLTRYEYIGV